jgi:hypothetical protein
MKQMWISRESHGFGEQGSWNSCHTVHRSDSLHFVALANRRRVTYQISQKADKSPVYGLLIGRFEIEVRV